MKVKRPGGAAGHSLALTPQQALWLELMQFYIREAWLLDERKLEEWLQLFTDDVLYFMPRRKNVPRREQHRELTPLGDLAILEEDKRYLEMRVARLDTGMAWAEDPPSRTRHLIGNLEATPLENGEARAKTAFLVYRSHLETDHQLLSGCRDDVLRKRRRHVEGGEAHDRPRRQRPPRQKPQRLPLASQLSSSAGIRGAERPRGRLFVGRRQQFGGLAFIAVIAYNVGMQ